MLSLSFCPPSLSGLRPHWVSMSQAKSEWEGTERRSLEGLAQCRKEAQTHLRELQETVDSLPRQVGEGQACTTLPPRCPD